MQRPHCPLAGCGIDFRVELWLVDFVNSDSPLIRYWAIFHNMPPFLFLPKPKRACKQVFVYMMLHSYMVDTEMGKKAISALVDCIISQKSKKVKKEACKRTPLERVIM